MEKGSETNKLKGSKGKCKHKEETKHKLKTQKKY